jgi:uncharacterized protein (DUF433 family)
MQSAIVRDQGILGGEPVFRGTRVPFKALIEYLEGGDTLDAFLEQYPSVNRELAVSAHRGSTPQPRSYLINTFKRFRACELCETA